VIITRSRSRSPSARAEFATLRTLGGSRLQILGSVMVEAIVIGIAASICGLVLGFGLAIGLMRLFEKLGLELPKNAMVIEPRTVDRLSVWASS